MKDFFKSLQRSFRRKKKSESSNPTVPANQGGVANGHAPVIPPPTEIRSRTWSNRGGSPLPSRANSLHRGDQERHPGRRFTVTEDLESAWTRKGDGGGAKGGAKGGSATRGWKNLGSRYCMCDSSLYCVCFNAIDLSFCCIQASIAWIVQFLSDGWPAW